MSVEFKLPDLGENITSGDVVNVLVAVGDTLSEDQPVIELETDKAVIEVPSSVSGVVEAIHVKKGDKVAIGQAILTAKSTSSTPATQPAPPTAAPAPTTARVPAPPASPAQPVPAEARPLVPAAPSVRRLARGTGNRLAARRTGLRKFHLSGSCGAFLRHHTHHFGNNISGPVDHNRIADPHIEPLKFIFVVERGI